MAPVWLIKLPNCFMKDLPQIMPYRTIIAPQFIGRDVEIDHAFLIECRLAGGR